MPPVAMDRREFLLLGATGAALLAGCKGIGNPSQPPRALGTLRRYATTIPWDGRLHAVEIRLRSGALAGMAPLEGHPAAGTPVGVHGVYAAAAPEPVWKRPLHKNAASSWESLDTAGTEWFSGAGPSSLLVLPSQVSLPVLQAVADWSKRTGAKVLRCSGGELSPSSEDLDGATVLLCLGADPYAAADMSSARLEQARARGLRVVSVGGYPGLTARHADMHLPWPDHLLPSLIWRLAADVQGGFAESWETLCAQVGIPVSDALALERVLHPGSTRILVGSHLAEKVLPAVSQLSDSLNGGLLQAREYAMDWQDWATLQKDSGIRYLMVVDCDPDRCFPGFQELAAQCEIGIGILRNDQMPCARQLTWVAPATDALRSGGAWLLPGATAVSLGQPLLSPENIHDTASLLLSWLEGFPYSLTRHEARARSLLGLSSPGAWEGALRSGVVPAPELPLQVRKEYRQAPINHLGVYWILRSGVLSGWNGSGGDWEQDIPHPLWGGVWEHPLVIHPHTARQVGLQGTVRLGGVSFSVHQDMRVAQGEVHVEMGSLQTKELLALRDWLQGRSAPVVLSAAPASRNLLLGMHLPAELRHASLPAVDNGKRRWGMVVDLGLCTGCSACVSACAVENNRPVAGADAWSRGRDNHWIRVERGEDWFLPVTCQQCGDAPCEKLCPTGASTHSSDGLSQMVTARCIGTRLCAAGCPYSVRKFRFDGSLPATLAGDGASPGPRGTMEKCTFCAHRLHDPQWQGMPRTACQEACPAGAILFGDLAKPDAAMADALEKPSAFRLLGGTGVDPSIVYLEPRQQEER